MVGQEFPQIHHGRTTLLTCVYDKNTLHQYSNQHLHKSETKMRNNVTFMDQIMQYFFLYKIFQTSCKNVYNFNTTIMRPISHGSPVQIL